MGKPEGPDDSDLSSPLKEDPFLKSVGLRVRKARQRSGLTPLQVIERAGVSKAWLYMVETGLSNFTIEGLRRLLTVLGADLKEVFVSDWEIDDHSLRNRVSTLATQASQEAGAALNALTELRATLDELARVTKPPLSEDTPDSA